MVRIIYFLAWLLVFIIPVMLAYALPGTMGHRFYRYFYQIITTIFRVKIVVKGEPLKEAPVLFVSNHVSYMDILVLGAVLPGFFISKAEVAKWPIIGWLGRFNGTVYVNRKKSAVNKHLDALDEAIESKKSLILFPEGTTSDGRRVLPFKSSLLKIAETKNIPVQPVTINYTHINGLPIQTNERTKIAWIGDTSFTPHFKELVSMGIIRVEVTIHEPVASYKDRKELALKAYDAVASAL